MYDVDMHNTEMNFESDAYAPENHTGAYENVCDELQTSAIVEAEFSPTRPEIDSKMSHDPVSSFNDKERSSSGESSSSDENDEEDEDES